MGTWGLVLVNGFQHSPRLCSFSLTGLSLSSHLCHWGLHSPSGDPWGTYSVSLVHLDLFRSRKLFLWPFMQSLPSVGEVVSSSNYQQSPSGRHVQRFFLNQP